jgi:hypothetical protein
MCGLPLAVVGEMLGHKDDRTTKRYAHLANHVVRQGLEAATDRIVAASRPVAALTPPPFERLTEHEWKRIGPMVEATRGTCGGTRTDLRRAVDAVRWILHNGAKWRADLRRPGVACDRGRPRAATRAGCRALQADDRGRGGRGPAVQNPPGPLGGPPPVCLNSATSAVA